jgi:hypothetical protein
MSDVTGRSGGGENHAFTFQHTAEPDVRFTVNGGMTILDPRSEGRIKAKALTPTPRPKGRTPSTERREAGAQHAHDRKAVRPKGRAPSPEPRAQPRALSRPQGRLDRKAAPTAQAVSRPCAAGFEGELLITSAYPDAPGPSVFDLSVSGCPPAHSEGLGRAPKNKYVCCF